MRLDFPRPPERKRVPNITIPKVTSIIWAYVGALFIILAPENSNSDTDPR